MEGVRVESPRMSAEFESEEEEEDIRRLVRRTSAERFRLWLAQGRWNEKEHSCVYISSNVSFGFVRILLAITWQRRAHQSPELALGPYGVAGFLHRPCPGSRAGGGAGGRG